MPDDSWDKYLIFPSLCQCFNLIWFFDYRHCRREVYCIKWKTVEQLTISQSSLSVRIPGPGGWLFKWTHSSFSFYGWDPLVQTWLLLGLYFPFLCLFSAKWGEEGVCTLSPLKHKPQKVVLRSASLVLPQKVKQTRT